MAWVLLHVAGWVTTAAVEGAPESSPAWPAFQSGGISSIVATDGLRAATLPEGRHHLFGEQSHGLHGRVVGDAAVVELRAQDVRAVVARRRVDPGDHLVGGAVDVAPLGAHLFPVVFRGRVDHAPQWNPAAGDLFVALDPGLRHLAGPRLALVDPHADVRH